jgi:hypothetical protein
VKASLSFFVVLSLGTIPHRAAGPDDAVFDADVVDVADFPTVVSGAWVVCCAVVIGVVFGPALVSTGLVGALGAPLSPALPERGLTFVGALKPPGIIRPETELKASKAVWSSEGRWLVPHRLSQLENALPPSWPAS